jgi:hypothetical protein
MAQVVGDSNSAGGAAVLGSNTGGGPAVWGAANPNGRGVVGVSDEGAGVWGHTKTGRGVVGVSDTGVGVWGANRSGRAVVGAVDEDGTGVWGEVKTGTGVVGAVHEGQGVGVSGRCDSGDGVVGVGRRGVVGMSPDYQGVYGHSVTNAGVVGESDQMHAVFAVTHSPTSAGIYATNTAGGQAALFDGDCVVTGDLVLAGADVAEQFDVAPGADVGPGSVVVLDGAGRLMPTSQAHDCRVVGIVSGAGDRKPAIVLDRPAEPRPQVRRPVAVIGKAWCLADASDVPVRPGDLLTSGRRPGHAQVAGNPIDAFGAVIGKALTGLESGTGQVLVLVGLG